jgi:hypothetical protein
MSLADDTSKAAIALQKNVVPLQSIVEKWSNRLFWEQEPDAQLKTLIREIDSNSDFQLELANALAWERPRSDSAELSLLTTDAARGKGPKVDPAVFGTDLDWNNWKKRPDLRQLQFVFENNSKVRNDFAKAIGAFPGLQHSQEIAIVSFERWKN